LLLCCFRIGNATGTRLRRPHRLRFGVRHRSLRGVAFGLVGVHVCAKKGGDDQVIWATLLCSFRTGNSTVSLRRVLVRLLLFSRHRGALLIASRVRAVLACGCTFAACFQEYREFVRVSAGKGNCCDGSELEPLPRNSIDPLIRQMSYILGSCCWFGCSFRLAG